VSPARVAVLGATGYVGRPLTAALAAAAEVEFVLAVGRRSQASAGFTGHVVCARCDVITCPLAVLLAEHRIDSLVHLVFISRPTRDHQGAFSTNVAGTARALTLAAAAGVRRAVVVSSVGVYGPRGADEPATEDQPPRPNGFVFSRHKALQELAAHGSAATAGLELAIARPCTIVGAAGANFVVDLLSAPLVPLPAGTDAPWQFLHVDDFCEGMLRLLVSDATGPYNLVPRDAVPLREAVGLLGGRTAAVPRPLLTATARATWALHAGRAVPATALAFLDRPPVASGARLHEDVGFVPTLSSRGALVAPGRRAAAPAAALRPLPEPDR
jgi:UDP-glucose 4-epimerase